MLKQPKMMYINLKRNNIMDKLVYNIDPFNHLKMADVLNNSQFPDFSSHFLRSSLNLFRLNL